MDLRPTLTDSFLDAILDDLERNAQAGRVNWGSATPAEHEQLREHWRGLILERFVSRSVQCEAGEGCWVSCEHPDTVNRYINKYPGLIPVIAHLREAALLRWPNARFGMELHSDPESCHIVHEGQHLVLHIYTDLPFYGPEGEMEGSPYDLADADWLDFTCSDEFEDFQASNIGDLNLGTTLHPREHEE